MVLKKVADYISLVVTIVKTSIFDLVFAVEHHSISNSLVLLILDLLELATLPYFYINPIFTHLENNEQLEFYFDNLHFKMYHVSQNLKEESFPVALITFSTCFLIVFFTKKQLNSHLALLANLLLALIPFFILRIGSEIVNMGKNEFSLVIVAAVCLGPIIFSTVLILCNYGKMPKVLDLFAAILVFSDINQFALIGLLAVKILMTLVWTCSIYGKYIKIGLESSLLVSIFLLLFIKAVLINYMMLLSLVLICTIYPSFVLFTEFESEEVIDDNSTDNVQESTNESYTASEINFFNSVQNHFFHCSITECKCKDLMKVKNTNDLKKVIPYFEKQCLRNQIYVKKEDSKEEFLAVLKYIELCLKTEKPDWSGFILLYQIESHNIFDEYKLYKYKKHYGTLLQRETPKTLNMRVINEGEASCAYQDLLLFEDLVCQIIKKVKHFWNELLNFQGEKDFIELILQISEDISQVNKFYAKIDQNYDEKEETEFYYGIFKLLVLHERSSMSLIDQHITKYLMVTRGTKIINISLNLTHLVEKRKDEIIGNHYNLFMPSAYINDHEEWKETFLDTYQPSSDNNFTKPICISSESIKVVDMTHILIPNFDTHEDKIEKAENEEMSGISIVSLMRSKVEEVDVNTEKEKFSFHLLVDRTTFDIISYETGLFEYFEIEQSVSNCSKLLRSNVKDIFPNLNKEAILKKEEEKKKLIGKFNGNFFKDNEEWTGAKSLKKLMIADDKEDDPEEELTVEEVCSTKNEELNILLLAFESYVSKVENSELRNNEHKSSTFNLMRRKTLKNIVEISSQQKEEEKKSVESFTRIKVIMYVSFFVLFLATLSIFVVFEFSKKHLNDFTKIYDKKFEFYTDLAYTQSYFLSFPVGENRINSLHTYWSYNTEYFEMFSILSQIEKEQFYSKFVESSKIFYERPAFTEVSEKLEWLVSIIEKNRVIGFVLFYVSLVVTVFNFGISIVIFLKSEAKSMEIISSFLNFDAKAIRSNLKKMESLEKILELHDYSLPPQSNEQAKLDRQGSITSLVELEPSKKRGSFVSKINMHDILNNYFEQLISKKEIEPDPQTLNTSRRKMKTIINFNKKSEEVLEAEMNTKKQNFSVFQNARRNIFILVPSFVGFFLNVCISIIAILVITIFLHKVLFCLELKQHYLVEPILALQKVETEYYRISSRNKYDMNLYNYEGTKMAESLPSEFESFNNFEEQIKLSDNLCDFMEENSEFWRKCENSRGRFKTGLKSVIGYMDEEFRKIKSGEVNSSVLMESNEFLLCLEVFLQIINSRNTLYTENLAIFVSKHFKIIIIIEIILLFFFLVCFSLKIKETQLASDKTEKAQNLFKIVPSFMKNRRGMAK